MSRGPGKIERAIEAAFASKPGDIFTTEDLTALAYPGINRAEKKHRVAVIRAADRAARRMGWKAWRREAPGHELVYLNLRNVRSYAIGRMRADFTRNNLTTEDLRQIVDGTHPHQRYYTKDAERAQPGGAWWVHVQINCAEFDGRTEEAEQMRQDWNAPLEKRLRALGMTTGG